MKRLRPHLEVALLYVAMAIVATWPLLPNIATHYPSPMPWYGGDPNIFTWWIDWMAKAILGQLPVAAGKMVFWPVGVNPMAGWDGIIMALVGVPVRLITGNAILAYNAIVLAALIGTAFSAYLLCHHLTRSRYAAFFGGTLFGFSTYMMVRLTQHANLMMLFAVPLLILATVKFCERPDRRSALWLGAATLIASLSSWYYLLTGAIFVAVAFIAFRKNLWAAKKALAIACVAMLLAALIPALPALLSGTRGGQAESLDFIRGGGAQPLNFVLPHPFTNIFGQLTKPLYKTFPETYWGSAGVFEATSYFGMVILASLLALAVFRKKIRVVHAGLWTTTLVLFTVLALGVDVQIGGLRVPMPFRLLVEIFPFSRLRVPNRFFIFALSAGSVIASFAIAAARQRLKTATTRGALTALLALTIAADQMIFPFPLVALTVPDFYRLAAKDTDTYAIADLPIIYPGFSEYDFFQTVHGKPIVEAEFFYTAYSPETFSYIKNNPLLAGSICRKTTEMLPAPDKEAVFASLRDDDIRYVVVHNLLLHNTPECEEPRRFIRAFFHDEKPAFVDGEITAYRVPGRK
jgi:hypothetical protein